MSHGDTVGSYLSSFSGAFLSNHFGGGGGGGGGRENKLKFNIFLCSLPLLVSIDSVLPSLPPHDSDTTALCPSYASLLRSRLLRQKPGLEPSAGVLWIRNWTRP